MLALLVACGGPTRAAPPTPRFTALDGDLAITNVTVVDVLGGQLWPDRTVIVRGDLIVAVDEAALITVPATVTAIDGSGQYLMPGLADMHVHPWLEADLTMFVAAGVTTVRNTFGAPMHLEWRAKITTGELFGPTLVTSGLIVDGDPPIWPGSAVATTAAEGDQAVMDQKAAGYDFVKVYSRLSLEAYDGIAAAAKREQIVFAGHVPNAVPLAHALAAGQKSIEHMTGYLAAVQKDGVIAPTGATYTQTMAARVANLDEAKIPAIAALTAKSDTWNCPTMIVMDRIAGMTDPAALAKRTRWLEYVSAETLAYWDPKQDFRLSKLGPDDFAVWKQAAAMEARILVAVVEAGGKLLVGTDMGNPYVVAGASLHEEIELLVAAGLPRALVLRAATAGAAEYLGLDGKAGVVAAGARADLILTDSNPLAGAIAIPPVGIVLRGHWHDRADLQARLDGVKP